MSGILLSLLAKGWPWLLTFLGGVAAMIVAYRKGSQSEKAKQATERAETISEAKAIEDAVAGNDAAENRKELGTWGRG